MEAKGVLTQHSRVQQILGLSCLLLLGVALTTPYSVALTYIQALFGSSSMPDSFSGVLELAIQVRLLTMRATFLGVFGVGYALWRTQGRKREINPISAAQWGAIVGVTVAFLNAVYAIQTRMNLDFEIPEQMLNEQYLVLALSFVVYPALWGLAGVLTYLIIGKGKPLTEPN